MPNEKLIKKVKLIDICNPKQWKTISMSELLGKGYPVYGANGKIGFYSKYTHETPTLMITCRGATCGSLNISEPNSYINGNAMALDSLKQDIVDINYLYYALRNRGFKDVISGSAQPQITRQGLQKVTIALPSIEEQKKSIQIFNAADSLRQKRKEQIKLLDDYLKSVFYEMFGDPVKNEKGWEIRTLQDLTTKLGDGLHGTPIYTEEGDYCFINGNNLENGEIIIKDSTKRVSREEFEEYKKPLNETSMLVSINGTLGRVAFYHGEKVVLGKSVCYFNVKQNEVNLSYLYNILKSEYFLKHATDNSTGSTIKNVSLKTMRGYPVVLPPLSLQNKFATIVQKTESIKQKMHASLDEMDNLFNALMQRCFW